MEKTLRYGLEHATRILHSKFGPVLKDTDLVLSRYAVNELKHAVKSSWNVIYTSLPYRPRPAQV